MMIGGKSESHPVAVSKTCLLSLGFAYMNENNRGADVKSFPKSFP